VGRLDRDTSGLLIFTNDHALACRLTEPNRCVPKTYHARLRGIPAPEALAALTEGVPLPGGATTRPARVHSLGVGQDGSTWVEIVLTEGKNRQVRRMCACVGHDVLELARVAIGSLTLGDLVPGQWRRLTESEIVLLAGTGTG
jgi:pseudouridine synthase